MRGQKLRIAARSYDQWPQTIRRRLQYATLEEGEMKDWAKAFPSSDTLVAFSPAGLVAGWLLTCRVKDETFMSVFVNKRHRGRGIAGTLIKRALGHHKKLTAFPWDEASQALFRGIRKKHAGRFILRDNDKFGDRYGTLLDYAGVSLK